MDDTPTWVAPDGTTWVQHLELGEWSGWEADEDGCWHLSDEEFHDWYPEAPHDLTAVSSKETTDGC